MREIVCGRQRGGVCVCVCESRYECERLCVKERVYIREKGVCVRVCVREKVCV